jgi:hypothetical protein
MSMHILCMEERASSLRAIASAAICGWLIFATDSRRYFEVLQPLRLMRSSLAIADGCSPAFPQVM